MLEEVKIRVADPLKAEKLLLEKGARFLRESVGIDTHFKQPADKVLKISDHGEEGVFLVELLLKDGKFQIMRREEIGGVDTLKSELEKKFGVHKVIKKIRRFFSFAPFTHLQICSVPGVGAFLIAEGEELDRVEVAHVLGISDPSFEEQSFDRL